MELAWLLDFKSGVRKILTNAIFPLGYVGSYSIKWYLSISLPRCTYAKCDNKDKHAEKALQEQVYANIRRVKLQERYSRFTNFQVLNSGNSNGIGSQKII